jgi:hypothetical protein
VGKPAIINNVEVATGRGYLGDIAEDEDSEIALNIAGDRALPIPGNGHPRT